MEGRNPLRAVLSPQQHPLAGRNLKPVEQRRKAPCHARQFAIGCHAPPVALVANHGYSAVKAAEVVKQRGQMRSHGSPGKDKGNPCTLNTV